MVRKKQVRIMKKIRDEGGVWRFVSLRRVGNRYLWDDRPGYYFLEWWEGKKRRRELAGHSPAETLEAQRRKRNESLRRLQRIAERAEVKHPTLHKFRHYAEFRTLPSKTF